MRESFVRPCPLLFFKVWKKTLVVDGFDWILGCLCFYTSLLLLDGCCGSIVLDLCVLRYDSVHRIGPKHWHQTPTQTGQKSRQLCARKRHCRDMTSRARRFASSATPRPARLAKSCHPTYPTMSSEGFGVTHFSDFNKDPSRHTIDPDATFPPAFRNRHHRFTG